MTDPIAPSPSELTAAKVWRQHHLLDPDGPVPFSCRLDGKLLDLHDGHWRVTRTDEGLDAFHADFGLRLRCRARAYEDFPAVEWTVELEQTEQGRAPLISELLGLDCRWQAGEKRGFAVRGINGDTYDRRDLYAPWSRRVSGGSRGFTVAPTWGSGLVATGDDLATAAMAHEKLEGRSCSGTMPFFAVEEWAEGDLPEAPPVGGFLMAVGWPGCWRAEFACEGPGQIRVRAGQETTSRDPGGFGPCARLGHQVPALVRARAGGAGDLVAR